MPTRIKTTFLLQQILLILETAFFRGKLSSGVDIVWVGSLMATPILMSPTSKASMLPGFRSYSPSGRVETIVDTIAKASFNLFGSLPPA